MSSRNPRHLIGPLRAKGFADINNCDIQVVEQVLAELAAENLIPSNLNEALSIKQENLVNDRIRQHLSTPEVTSPSVSAPVPSQPGGGLATLDSKQSVGGIASSVAGTHLTLLQQGMGQAARQIMAVEAAAAAQAVDFIKGAPERIADQIRLTQQIETVEVEEPIDVSFFPVPTRHGYLPGK